MKIIVLDGYTLNPGDLSWESLESLGEVTVYDRTSTLEDVIRRIGDGEIVLTNKTPLPAIVFEKCPNIRYIGVLATGYNIVDIKAAFKHGILVTHIPSYGTQAVAQFAIALLLEITNQVGYHRDAVKKGKWATNPDWCFWDRPLIELAGKTMGIIGFGRIGQVTGTIAKSMGMNIIAHDKIESDPGREIAQYVSQEEIFAKSDVIVLHCPLFPETENIIDKKNIEMMKDGVIIINNSRGALIVEEDLAEALNSGKVYAAGLDVVREEPIQEDNPLLQAKNCIITPHISWAAKESRERLMKIAVDNVASFLKGKIKNKVE
ncbi:MAG: D-2-hydroxyacid dehydrogenase [Tissierellia bacterium]|nr:D-2-hydroxyacid dehydrogenase [Tissierellia bacterium]